MTPRLALPATIATSRLVLRAPVMTDLADLVTLANNWQVIEPTAVMPFPYLEEHGRSFLQRVGDPQSPLAYAIARAGRLIGVVSLKFEPGKRPELGYWLGQPHWGQGFAPEAVIGLLDAARASGQIPQISARVLESNPGSIRVLEKAGFTIEERTHSVVERHRGKPLLIMAWSAA
jgi:RimJ/RimL family protein N-acetyltransferase